MRTRNLKPGFFKNELLAECSPHARILFAGLWCMADREGRIENRHIRIRAEIFPFEQVDVRARLEELEECEFVRLYEVEGQKLISVVNFQKHQNPHPREAPSALPKEPCKYTAEPCKYTAEPGSASGSSSSNNSGPPAVAAAVSTDDSETLLRTLVDRGLASAIARELVEAAGPAIIREALAYQSEQKKLRNPVGALRSMIEKPETWGFELTESGWRRPAQDVPPGETTDRRLDRIRQQRAEADQQRTEAAGPSKRLLPKRKEVT